MASIRIHRPQVILCVALTATALTSVGCSQGGGGNDNGSVSNDNAAANDNSGGGGGNDNGGGGNDNNGGGGGNDNGGGGNDNNGGGNDNSGGGGGAQVTVVDTGLDAHIQSPVEVSDRLIAFRSNETGSFVNRVFDVQTGEDHDVTSSETTFGDDFAVSGTDVILRGADLGVYHFDALNPAAGATHVSAGVPLQDISFGGIDTDGGNIVAFITQAPTLVCWVDLHDEPLFINTFGFEPDNGTFHHASVDGTRVAVFDGSSKIVIRDTASSVPGSGLREFAVNADTEGPMDFKDGYIVYTAFDSSGGILHVLDTSTGQDTATDTRVAGNMKTRNGTYCSFRNNSSDDSRGANFASVVGNTASAASYDTAPRLETIGRADPGWGSTCAVSFDGSIVFISGTDEPADLQTDLLTRRSGASLTINFAGDFTSADANEPMLVSASNVTAGNGLIGMLLYTGTPQDAHIGYIAPE